MTFKKNLIENIQQSIAQKLLSCLEFFLKPTANKTLFDFKLLLLAEGKQSVI